MACAGSLGKAASGFGRIFNGELVKGTPVEQRKVDLSL